MASSEDGGAPDTCHSCGRSARTASAKRQLPTALHQPHRLEMVNPASSWMCPPCCGLVRQAASLVRRTEPPPIQKRTTRSAEPEPEPPPLRDAQGSRGSSTLASGLGYAWATPSSSRKRGDGDRDAPPGATEAAAAFAGSTAGQVQDHSCRHSWRRVSASKVAGSTAAAREGRSASPPRLAPPLLRPSCVPVCSPGALTPLSMSSAPPPPALSRR